MNTFNSSINEKKLFTALLISAVAVSCNIESQQDTLGLSMAEQAIVIEAVHDDGDVDTKTVRNGDGSVSWQSGDQISLFFGSGSNGGSAFTTNDSGKTASFTGTISAFTAGGEEFDGGMTYFWGLYPYDPNATCDNSSVTTSLSSVQRGTAGSFSPGQHVTIARSENLLMSFKSVVSGFKFTLQTEGIESAVFHPLGDEPVVGDITISMSDNLPEITSMVNTSSEIVLVPDGGEFEVGKDYYFEFAPFTAAGGFEVVFYKGNQQATFTYGSSRTFSRNKFTSVADIDTRLGEWTIRQGNIPFEDANFKAYCINNFDSDGDGEISLAEAKAVTEIDCSGISYQKGNIVSLDGIQFFTSLTSLSCAHNELDSLDLSNNTALVYLNCNSNKLASLDVSNNTALENLYCYSNQLTILDVSNNTALDTLHCYWNQLANLDVSKNTSLKYLDCGLNQLTSLDLSSNIALVGLNCNSNKLASLDVSNNTELTYLSCSTNQLSSLDISNNTALKSLSCSTNQLASLDVSNNAELIDLSCFTNQLSSLDISNNTALKSLSCSSNQLTSLDVSNNAELIDLSCSTNQLSSLDISNNTALKFLWCDNNQLTILDVSGNEALADLDCSPMGTLEMIIMKEGQIIDRINSDRDPGYIPYHTVILYGSIDPDENGYVDLGLSVKWAACNLGASAPEDCGDYYAWGETTVKNGYVQSNYQYCEQDSDTHQYNYTKYSANDRDQVRDGKTVLAFSDDAARVNLGGNWRMPTRGELSELASKCSMAKATKNGVSGFILTGPNGKSIFLPAGGRKVGTDVMTSTDGFYWSSCLFEDTSTLSDKAISMRVYCTNGGSCGMMNTFAQRFYGLLIRPVYDEDATGGLQSLSLNNSELTIEEGSFIMLKATATWKSGCLNKVLDWSSSNPDVASVDNNGRISTYSPGTAIISVKPVCGTTTASCRVTVTELGDYFAVTAVDDNTSVSLSTDQSVEYRKPGDVWKDWDGSIDLNQDETVYFRGFMSSGQFDFYNGVKLSGNILSLIDGEVPYTNVISGGYNFAHLFDGCRDYIDASELILPSNTTQNCYWMMFANCSGLVAAPALPAMELSPDCYKQMFMNCTSLAEAPALPATKLAACCYQSMFENCTSLRSAPSLNATTLATMCYASMFKGCSQLSSVPAINGTPSYSYCFDEMFSGCKGLTTAPLLKGPIFGSYSCRRMFYGCTNLVNPPVVFSYLTEYILNSANIQTFSLT